MLHRRDTVVLPSALHFEFSMGSMWGRCCETAPSPPPQPPYHPRRGLIGKHMYIYIYIYLYIYIYIYVYVHIYTQPDIHMHMHTHMSAMGIMRSKRNKVHFQRKYKNGNHWRHARIHACPYAQHTNITHVKHMHTRAHSTTRMGNTHTPAKSGMGRRACISMQHYLRARLHMP